MRLGIAALAARLWGTGVLYHEGPEMGIVWWMGTVRHTLVLSTVN